MPHPVDVITEFGEARQVHILAAKRIFDDRVKRSIERQVLAQRAKKIEALSCCRIAATDMDSELERLL